MDKETRCREPSPRVLSIQSIHPDPGKSYLPHCTVLHRCAEDTGCCTNRAMKCGPKHQTRIYLYFYVSCFLIYFCEQVHAHILKKRRLITSI